MTDDTFELSRRTALAVLGGVGAASAGAGLGTSAFFGDRETFQNDSLTAGSLHVEVAVRQHHVDRLPDTDTAGVSAPVDPIPAPQETDDAEMPGRGETRARPIEPVLVDDEDDGDAAPSEIEIDEVSGTDGGEGVGAESPSVDDTAEASGTLSTGLRAGGRLRPPGPDLGLCLLPEVVEDRRDATHRRELAVERRERDAVGALGRDRLAVERAVVGRGRVAGQHDLEAAVRGHPDRRRDAVVGRQPADDQPLDPAPAQVVLEVGVDERAVDPL